MIILSNSGRPAYGIKRFIIETDEDIANLPLNIAPGSSAKNIITGQELIFTGQTNTGWQIDSSGLWQQVQDIIGQAEGEEGIPPSLWELQKQIDDLIAGGGGTGGEGKNYDAEIAALQEKDDTLSASITQLAANDQRVNILLSEFVSELQTQIDDIKGDSLNNNAVSPGLEFVAVEGGYRLIGLGSFNGPDLVVPATYNGLPVIGIGSAQGEISTALTGNTLGLKTIIIPEGITYIGAFAFNNAKYVEYIDIGSSVTYMGMSAFSSNGIFSAKVIMRPIDPLPVSLWIYPFSGFTNLTLYVQKEAISRYKSAFYWSSFDRDTNPIQSIPSGNANLYSLEEGCMLADSKTNSNYEQIRQIGRDSQKTKANNYLMAYGEDVQADNYNYGFYDRLVKPGYSISSTSEPLNDEIVILPSVYKGWPVFELSDWAYIRASENTHSLIIPKSMEYCGISCIDVWPGLRTVEIHNPEITFNSQYPPFAENAETITDIYVPWYEWEKTGAPWGATNATIHYGTVFEEETIPSLTELQNQINDIKENGTGGGEGKNYDADIQSLNDKDADLQEQINKEKTNREAQDNAVLAAAADAIAQNVANLVASDTSLQEQINGLKSVDTDTQSEISKLKEKDTELNKALTDNVTAIMGALIEQVTNLSGIDTQLSTAIGNEQSTRKSKDEDLQSQIDALLARIEALEALHAE